MPVFVSLTLLFQVLRGGETSTKLCISVPASSAMMASPIGCVAPVTTQTNPYYLDSKLQSISVRLIHILNKQNAKDAPASHPLGMEKREILIRCQSLFRRGLETINS